MGAHATLLWLTDAGALSEAALAGHAAWLGPSELARCGRFVRPLRRRQFIVGRALLRRMAGRLLGMRPADVVLTERAGQAPLLALNDGRFLGFSIAHSGPWVACAASLECAVGLDIECIDPARAVLALAEQAFGAADVDRLRACAGEQRLHLFYRLWCLHEAAIKLGQQAAADVCYRHPGLALALRCARTPAKMPRLEVVTLPGAGLSVDPR